MTKLRYCLPLIALVLIVTSGAQSAEPSSAYFRDWLLCGPIALDGPDPIAGATQHLRGFDRNYLEAQGKEGAVRPQAGQKVVFPGGEAAWKSWQSPTDAIDLDEAVSTVDGALAYAFTEFEVDSAQAAVLALGSNDGCRVWLNGEEVFDYPHGRGLVLDSDLIPVLLRQGSNRLLVKVEDKGHAWGLSCRLLPLEQNERWKRLNLFGVSSPKGKETTLDFIAAPSLLNTLITEATVSIRDDDGDVLWSGPWVRQEHMVLPVDTANFGNYVLVAEATFAGGLSATFRQPFTVGTPIDYTLFADGKSDYVIALAESASESEQWAVSELIHQITAIGGVALPLADLASVGDRPAIVVGWNDLAQKLVGPSTTAPAPDDESFVYRNVGKDIVIYGGSQRGTMYGVMAFLENELGVRFYTPAVTVAPKRNSLTFRLLRHTDQPGIRVRNDFYKEAFDPTWAAPNRVNGAMGTREQI
ncbi:MAG: hypothetical protein L3K26_13405, partial [Candidatus Hydrogenedentes bacterium]|nr:hypothetical protein [Candidatus Hydrogenedentota bacterium]